MTNDITTIKESELDAVIGGAPSLNSSLPYDLAYGVGAIGRGIWTALTTGSDLAMSPTGSWYRRT